MLDFFKKLRKQNYKSIYDRIIDLKSKNLLDEKVLVDFYSDKNYIPGSYEYDFLNNNVNIKNIKTYSLNKAIDLYYNKDSASIMMICDFFNKNTALEAIKSFENYIFSQDNFDEQKLLGLSILLMRDTNSFEAVKFGILLSKYYQLENAQAAVNIIKNLGIYPDFTFYSLSALKNLQNYDKLYLEIEENTLGLGKEIGEIINETR